MEKFKQIAEFGKKFVTISGVDNALEVVTAQAKKLVNADRCSVFMVDKEENILWSKISDGIGRIVISKDSGIVGDVYNKQESEIVNAPYDDDRFLPNIDKKSGYTTRNMICVPIFDSKRDVMGIIQLLNKSRFDFDEKDLEMLTFFANYVSGTLELVMMNES